MGTPDATVAVTAGATLTVAPDADHTVHVPVTLTFAADGSFTASAGVDLGALGVGSAGSTGTLVLASKDMPTFDPATVGANGDPFTLPPGITLLLDYQPTGAVSAALKNLQLPAPDTIAVRATLSDTGFDASAHLQFGAADQGAKLFAQNTPGGAAAYVNDLSLGFQLGASSGTLTVSGSAYVVIPKLYPNGQPSQVEVTLGGSLGVTTEGAVSVAIQFDITGLGGPWTDAFGIQGLSVDQVAGKIGVKVSAETAGIPVPTLAFKVDNLQLPTAWNDAIGIQNGTKTSLNLVLDVNNPILGFSIVGKDKNSIAVKPFTIVKTVAGNVDPGLAARLGPGQDRAAAVRAAGRQRRHRPHDQPGRDAGVRRHGGRRSGARRRQRGRPAVPEPDRRRRRRILHRRPGHPGRHRAEDQPERQPEQPGRRFQLPRRVHRQIPAASPSSPPSTRAPRPRWPTRRSRCTSPAASRSTCRLVRTWPGRSRSAAAARRSRRLGQRLGHGRWHPLGIGAVQLLAPPPEPSGSSCRATPARSPRHSRTPTTGPMPRPPPTLNTPAGHAQPDRRVPCNPPTATATTR